MTPKGYTIGNTGDGKTLYAVSYARKWRIKNPTGLIYANLHINLPKCYFTPYMVLPFEYIKTCGLKILIIYDDVSNLEDIKRFAKMLANASRKLRIEMFITAQVKIMIDKSIRRIADYKVKTYLNKQTDTLTAYIKYRGKGMRKVRYYNVIETVIKYDLYDTNEIVEDALESDIVREISKISKCKKDVEKNLFMLFGNKVDRRRLLKDICKKKGYNEEDNPKEEEIKKKKEKLRKLRKTRLDKQMKIMVKFFVEKVRLDESMTYLKGKLYQQLDKIKGSILIQEDNYSEIITRATAIYRDKKFEETCVLKKEKELRENEEKNNLYNYDLAILNSHFKIPYRSIANSIESSYSTVYNRVKEQRNKTKEKFESLTE